MVFADVDHTVLAHHIYGVRDNIADLLRVSGMSSTRVTSSLLKISWAFISSTTISTAF